MHSQNQEEFHIVKLLPVFEWQYSYPLSQLSSPQIQFLYAGLQIKRIVNKEKNIFSIIHHPLLDTLV